jgi:hypothetical protein
MAIRILLVPVLLAVLSPACSGGPPSASSHAAGAVTRIGRADIGGYSLAYECAGAGRPTVILEAGYTASGIDTYGRILPVLAMTARVCTYDRAGDGTSDPRPASVRPLTGATQARELHALLAAIHVGGPYVLVGHSSEEWSPASSRRCTRRRWWGSCSSTPPASPRFPSTTGFTPAPGTTARSPLPRTAGSTSTRLSVSSSAPRRSAVDRWW